MTSKHTQEVVLEGGPEELPKEILLTCQEEASNEGFVKIKVHHFSAIRDVRKLYLDPVTIHGKQWRILIFPQGNQAESISLYLDYVGPKEGRWAVCADFAIAIEAEDQIHTREANHRYCEDEGDWGFTNFIPKKFFYSEEKGKRVLVDDTLTLILAVRVLRDPTGILWHNFNNYDSKLETGFVGLKNQGATCYMNSILQSLYFTNYLRRAVFRMPTEDDDPAKSIPLALQRVFYHLQFSSKPVGTTELTKSFGWDAIDSFMQHDVQEFNRVLCDKLETKMKGTPVEGTINYLLEGKMKSFIRCMDVDFESSREESFYDIQLNVKGFKTLKESFDDYIQEETLEGDNKYFAEGHGLQRAKKGIIFTKLPPVLHLQLKRFEYDMMKDAMVKINDHHEFPESIDLSKYLDPATRTDEPQVYHLHGVLVHSGDLHGGHYCAFIRPETGGEWFKFDDDRVTKCLQREAMNDNFGIDPDAPKDAPRVVSRFSKKFTNAYMLVYVRETDTAKVLCPVLETDVNQAARERFLLEQKMEEERRREKEEQHLYMQIYIVTKEIMRNHHLTDLCSFDSKTSTPASALPLKVKKEATCQEFKELVAQKTGIPIERQRLWMMAKRQNGTIRPDECLDRFTDETMYSIKETLKVHTDPKIFVEESSVDPAVEGNVEYFEPLSPSDILLFVKSYDPSKSLLSFDDHFIVKKNEKPSDLAVRIQERNKQPFEHTLKFYEEIRPTMIERIKNKETWQTLEIGVGDIVCYSQDLPQEEMAQYEHATPKEYYDYIQNSITVHFKERNSPKDPSKQFSLQLSKKNNYDTVAEAVAKHLNTTPLMLRFTSHNHYTEMPKQEFKREPTKPLTDMLQPNQYQPATDILYYEVLEIPITELENKKAVTLSWVNSKLVEENTFKLLVEKDATAEQLVEILRQKLLASSGAAPAQTSVGSPGMVASPAPILDSPKDSDTEMKDAPEVAETSGAPPPAAAPAANSASPKPLQGTGEIRLIEIFNNRISKVIPKEEPIKSINEYSSFYAEEIPADQISIPEGDQLVSVFHFHKDPYSSHGIPFLFVLKQGEHFKDTLVRLQQRLAISDKEFEKYKVAFVSFGRVKYITEDDAVLAETKFSYNDYLALDHVDKTPRQSRSHYEKAIVIRN